MRPNKPRIDWVLLGVLGCLLCIGITMVYSATHDEPGRHWQKQIAYATIGLSMLFGIRLVPAKFLYAGAYVFYGLSLLPLLYMIILKANSVVRWIALPGGFNLQPSELAKVALLLSMARLLSLHPVSLARPRTLIAPILLFIPPFLLVLNQPNLSTALSFVAMTGAMGLMSGLTLLDLFLLASPVLSVALTFNEVAWAVLIVILVGVMVWSRLSFKAILFWIVINMAAGFGALYVWNKVLYFHQRSRILTFVDPLRDPQGAGYQVLQSKVAIGSGELQGKGFLNGTQTNLSFLPEEHTDFIFSVMGEQFGFLGSIVVLGLFFLLLQRILWISVHTQSRFTALLAVGLFGILAFHIIVNISMTMGMMPVTGLPLPFFSYGGSFLISCLLELGILLHLDARGEFI